MSDFLASLAMWAVDGAITRAQSAIEEVPNRRPQSTQRNLVFIPGELKTMLPFLNVLSQEEVVDDAVKVWVRGVRELACDFEDCIEFVLYFEDWRPWVWRMVPSFMAEMGPLSVAAAELVKLRVLAEDAAMRQSRYSITSSGTNTRNGAGATALDMLIQARETTARQGFSDLVHLITQKDHGNHVIAVWGTCGDLGTTSVMRKAYNDLGICQKFTCRAWVKFLHHFNPHEFIRELTSQFYANTCEELHLEAIRGFRTISEATQGDHLNEFQRHVEEVKYLIVLEGLSSLADWDAITMFLPDSKFSSCIIVSTQQFEVASLCMSQSYQPLELKKFSDGHSVCAFLEVSQGDDDKAEEISAMYEMPDLAMTECPIIGRESEIRELCQYTTNAHKNSFQVISVCGIAGVGKSALMKYMLCNKFFSAVPFRIYGWVDVSRPFNLRDFTRNLLVSFRSESLQANGETGTKNPIQECRDLLEQPDCLVVIDNLQSKEEWDLIKAALLSRSSKSIVITITTNVSIATWCADKKELVFYVKGLQAGAAFDLLHREVERKSECCRPEDLQKYVKLGELIAKCGGLPNVIIEIAGLLAKKTMTPMDTQGSTSDGLMHTVDTNSEYDSLRGFSDTIRSTSDRFIRILETNPGLRALFDWMNSYFRDCPDFLKPCLLYLTLFPPDKGIRRRRAVRRWVAEGYCKDSENKSAEENGELFFAKLVDMNIIQHSRQLATTSFGEMRISLYQLNGFIREYIISRGAEENCVSVLESNRITQPTGRHLIISKSWQRNKVVFKSIHLSRLRSLTVYGQWESFFISKRMIYLRVLDLEDAPGVKSEDLKDMVTLMCWLKFLSLRGCRDVYSLPSSIGRLRQLQTLDIRNTPIVSLPAAIANLNKLQYICAGTSVTGEEPSTPRISLSRIRRSRHRAVGIEVPGGIHKLTLLQTFGIVDIGESRGKSILKELEGLTQLRKLGVSGVNKKNSAKFSSAISGHLHLESLSLQLDKENQSCMYGISLPLMSLRSLKLHGPLDKLPVLQIDQLSELTKLDLEMITLTEDAMKLIGALPKLCTLRVKLLQDSRLNFCVKDDGLELPTYQKITTLEIACSSNLEVTFGSETMRSLELLKAHCCNGSSVKFLYGLHNLSELKVLFLKGRFDEKLKVDLKSELGEHPMGPDLKLED